jgi:ABC-type taurine transport system ATPase subunit
MPHLSWNEVRDRAIRFARDPVHTRARSERSEKQTFWNDFFEVFGLRRAFAGRSLRSPHNARRARKNHSTALSNAATAPNRSTPTANAWNTFSASTNNPPLHCCLPLGKAGKTYPVQHLTMITRFLISNFKRLADADIQLGSTVVFIGPNNSGKTTALQALALWDVGWRRWAERREKGRPGKRPGVTINRRDLSAIPVPSARLLWNDLETQRNYMEDGHAITKKTYITLTAEGVHDDRPWHCSLEFYYANEESFYCRLKNSDEDSVPIGARQHKVVYLPPMSGLAEREYRKEQGEISILIGEGQTAQVLRNLCWQLYSREDKTPWVELVKQIAELFGIRIQEPRYVKERSELTLTYREASGVELDLSSAGRGCQQVLLLLSYLLANPGAVLLLDEPDAHLEILRQRDVYNLLTDIARQTNSQIVAASHSEVVLEEAAQRDVVMAFVGKPHRIDTRSGTSQIKKALESIRMSDYYLAEQKGWMLYLEGSTDLAVLRSLAARLLHPAHDVLRVSVPVHYIGGNKPQEARDHFHGLREAKPDLVAFALFDHLDKKLKSELGLEERMWERREIENYLVTPESLIAFVQVGFDENELFKAAERKVRIQTIERCIAELEASLRTARRPGPWSRDIKVTDDFLDPLFANFYDQLGTPQAIYERDYHGLADVIPVEQIAQEVSEVLDQIVAVSKNTHPSA